MAFECVRGHRLFPAGSACWFAALFGLSALAIRHDQLESLVLLAGLDGVIAPPLGMSARILTAAGFAGLGALAGLGLGRLMAIPRTEKVGGEDSALPGASLDEGAESACPDTGAPADALNAESPPSGDSRAALSGPPLGKAAERLLAAELATLSPIELVERLAIAMQCPGARVAEAAAFRAFGDSRAGLPLGVTRGTVRISGAA